MEIKQQNDITEFFKFIQTVKYDIANWQIIEVKLTEDGQKTQTIEDITATIDKTFEHKKGLILICNATEILTIIRLGSEIPTAYVSKKVERAVPSQACSIEVDTLSNGITRIKLDFMAIKENKPEPKPEKQERSEKIILLAEPSEKEAQTFTQSVGNIARAIAVNSARDTYQSYKEHSPDVTFITHDIDNSPHAYLMQQILQHDPKAYIILINNEGSTESILGAVEKGAKNCLLKPLSENAVMNALKSCPAFSSVFAA